MKRFALILLAMIGWVSVYAQTATDSLRQAAVIVDGLFFDNSMSPKSLIPGNSHLVVMKDPDGAMVLGVYLPEGFEMDESVKAKAIPAESVRYSDKLMRDYEERKPQTLAAYKGIGVKVGEPFVEFEHSDIDGNLWNNEKLRGKVYVINLWQSECGPCRGEMPVLSQWKEKYPDVVFLSASRHNREEILPIVERHNFTWTHLEEAKDLVTLVGGEGFPLTIVVDKDGVVRFAKVGATEENQAEAVATIDELSR